MSDIFHVLADSNRREILDILRAGERPAGALVAALALSQPGVSKHLRVLRRAGLVEVTVRGQQRLYALAPARLTEIDAWLGPYRRFWAGRLDALGEHLK